MPQKRTLSFTYTKLSTFCYPQARITKTVQKPRIFAVRVQICAQNMPKMDIYLPIVEKYAKIRNSDLCDNEI